MTERQDAEMLEEAEKRINEEMLKSNICTLKHPITNNLIMMSTIDMTSKTVEEAAEIKQDYKKKLLTLAERAAVEELSDEQIARMAPTTFAALEDLPQEFKDYCINNLAIYENTWVALRFFQYEPDSKNYYPVLVEVKDGSFVDPEDL